MQDNLYFIFLSRIAQNSELCSEYEAACNVIMEEDISAYQAIKLYFFPLAKRLGINCTASQLLESQVELAQFANSMQGKP